MKSLVKGLVLHLDMAKDDASQVAEEVKNVFKEQEEIEDGIISKDCRCLFYTLQEEGFMSVRREEVKQMGTSLRLRQYYWSLKMPGEQKREEEQNPYETVPEEAWAKRPKQ
ncbi:MAG: hypothetical protein PHH26_05475 [Candidatus Thermoplasmatota archaeon]|nr:hypothetical protein [Candidatus Thermoplasmatota archaeon]